jgi:hypothetical protein
MTPFRTALDAFHAAQAECDDLEEASARDIARLEWALSSLIRAPATGLSESVAKLRALCDFYEGGDVPVDHVAIVVGELSGLSGSIS